jgi:hypothetical protein
MTAEYILKKLHPKNMAEEKAIGMEILSTSGIRIPLNLDW